MALLIQATQRVVHATFDTHLASGHSVFDPLSTGIEFTDAAQQF